MVDFSKHLNIDEIAANNEAAGFEELALGLGSQTQFIPADPIGDDPDDDDDFEVDEPYTGGGGMSLASFNTMDPFDGSIWQNRLQYATKGEFLTGSAGTGKTYQIRKRMEEYESEYAGKCPIKLCATTGIAAVNMGSKVGTLNSLLGYFDTKSLKEAYMTGRLHGRLRDLNRGGFNELVIDEISMMDGRQLDLLVLASEELAAKDSGYGMKITLTGDFCQLAPVGVDDKKLPENERPIWAFEANCWPMFADNTQRLTKVWRQDSEDYVAALRAARSGNGKECVERLLGLGVKFHAELDEHFDGTTLRTKNDLVQKYNAVRLNQVRSQPQVIRSVKWGIPSLVKETRPIGDPTRKIEGQPSDWKDIPDQDVIKVGELVMILTNDSPHFSYANGDCGHIEEIDYNGGSISIRLIRTGGVVCLPMEVRTVETKKVPKEFKDRKDELIKIYDPAEAMQRRVPCRNEKGTKWVIGEVYYFPVRAAWATTVHKCVDPESIVMTPDGIRKVRQISAGDLIWNGEEFAPVAAVASTERELVIIRTRSGRVLRCSPEHPILTEWGQFYQAGEVTPGMVIPIADPPSPGEDLSRDDFMWLCGALLGDAWMAHPAGEVHFSKTNPVIQAEVKRIVEECGVHVGVRKDGRGLHFSDKRFRESLPIGYVNATEKSIPQMSMTPSQMAELVAGLIDTDGSVGHAGLVFTSKSAKLARGLHTVLLALGIKATNSEYYSDKSGTYWQVRVGSAGVEAFKWVVRLRNPEKRERLEQWKPNRVIQTWEKDEVVHVERLGLIMPMIDFAMKGKPQFWVDGFITHNSQGLSLDRLQVDMRDAFFKAPAMAYVALSRCKTPEGLRLVGAPEDLARKCSVHPKVVGWL